jgi:hypothetical protein
MLEKRGGEGQGSRFAFAARYVHAMILRRWRMATLRFHTPLGAEVWVPVTGETSQGLSRTVLEMQRTFGGLRLRGATPPPGGFRLPLANEPDFDWQLLGGSRGSCTVEGEEREGVWYAGLFYTRRELDPNPRMKLGAAVKYSRGARHTDPPEVVEDGDGTFR